MRHTRRVRPTMPMLLARRNMHHIADLQAARRLALRAHQAVPERHRQDLAAFVVVPERARAGGEADVVAHAVVGGEDWVLHLSDELG